MKQSFFPVAAAFAVLAASCTEHDPLCGQVPIRFGPCPIEVSTKTVNEITNLSSFNVMAVYGDGGVFFSDVATGGSSGYSTSVEHYYPDETIDVVASNRAITYSEDGSSPCIDYVQDKSCDVVAAVRSGIVRSHQPIVLSFVHILAQLEIRLLGKDSGYDYDVQKIRVLAPAGGKYDIIEDEWISVEPKSPIDISLGELSLGSEAVPVAEGPISLIPSEVRVRVVWTCTKNGVLCGTYDRDCLVTLTGGFKTTATLMLPNDDAMDMALEASVESWHNESCSEEVVRGVRPSDLGSGEFDVNSAGKRVMLRNVVSEVVPWEPVESIKASTGYDWELLSSSEWNYLWTKYGHFSMNIGSGTYNLPIIGSEISAVLVPLEWKLKNRGKKPPMSYTLAEWEQYRHEGFVSFPIRWTYWTGDGKGVQFSTEKGMTVVSFSETQMSQPTCRRVLAYQI